MGEIALPRATHAALIIDVGRLQTLCDGSNTCGETIRPLFELLGNRGQQIEVVTMDMNMAPTWI